jgi:uncharacterized repeat protein (TIGR03803 family)
MNTHTQNPYTCLGTASMRSQVLPALLVVLGFLLTGPVTAQTFKTLHAFTFSDGATPYSELVLAGNTLYGTASAGGNSGSYNGNGTLFAVNTDGSGFTNEYIFTAYPPGYYPTNGDGSVPFAGLILSSNTLYGAAYDGGAFGAGTLFAVNTNNGSSFTNLYTFTGGNDGGGPDAALVLSSNTLYGTTAYGGGANNGTVFAINTDGSSFTNLHVFTANSGFPSYTNSDGSNPNAGLVLSGRTLYGAAAQGGRFGSGTLFAVNTNGSGFTNLYTFTATSGTPLTNSDGSSPRGSLIASGGTLYGTAYNGGRFGSGTLFAIGTNGTGFTNLYTFTANSTAPYTNSDGSHPNAALLLSGNTLYGTAYNGGNPGTNVEYGTVFSFTFASISPPLLAINPSGTNVILTWPTNATGFTLESATNLMAPAVWTTNATTPAIVNTNNAVTNGITGTQKFYRLSQ